MVNAVDAVERSPGAEKDQRAKDEFPTAHSIAHFVGRAIAGRKTGFVLFVPVLRYLHNAKYTTAEAG